MIGITTGVSSGDYEMGVLIRRPRYLVLHWLLKYPFYTAHNERLDQDGHWFDRLDGDRAKLNREKMASMFLRVWSDHP